jgi:hypothetical protein
VPSAFVALKDLDVDNTEEKVEDQKDSCNGDIRYHVWKAAQSRIFG